MAMKTIFAAGAFSLILVGTQVKAQAEEPDPDARVTSDVVRLFGKTICTAGAPSDVRCDWRWPAAAGTRAEPSEVAVTLFGDRYCFGESSNGGGDGCDYRFPPPGPDRARSKVVRLLGLDVCFGDISPASSCELRLPPLPPEGERRASM
jgi:hypothetical protein